MKKFLCVFAFIFCAIVPSDAFAVVCKEYENDLSVLRAEWADKCWYCDFFGLLLTAAQKVGHSTFNALEKDTGYLSKLMTTGFALWIAYKVLMLIGAMSSGNDDKAGPEFVKDMILGLFRLGLAFIFLKIGIEYLWDMLVNRIAEIGLDIAQIIVKAGAGDALGDPPPINRPEGEGFAALKDNFMYVMNAINNSATKLFADGVGILGYARANGNLGCVIPMPVPFFISLAYMVLGLYIWFTVPFKMIDAVFQLIVLAVILPLLVVAWVFPYTRKQFVEKGLSMLINAIGMFITISIVIAIVAALLNSLFEGMAVSTVSELVENMLAGSGGTEATSTKTMLAFLGVAFFAYKAFGSIESLSSQIFGGITGSSIGQTMDNFAQSAIIGGGVTAAATVGASFMESARKGGSGQQPDGREQSSSTGGTGTGAAGEAVNVGDGVPVSPSPTPTVNPTTYNGGNGGTGS